EQRGGLAGAARTARCGGRCEREHGRVLLRLQHAPAVAASLLLATRPALLRLLRARAAQPSDRYHPPEGGDDAVLPVAHARRLEDVQYRRPDVLVLYGNGHRGGRQADRQHLLARRPGRVREPPPSVAAGL